MILATLTCNCFLPHGWVTLFVVQVVWSELRQFWLVRESHYQWYGAWRNLVVGFVVSRRSVKPSRAPEIAMVSKAAILISASVCKRTESLRCLCMSSRFARPPSISNDFVITDCYATSFLLSGGAGRMSRRGLFATPANKRISFYISICALSYVTAHGAHSPGLAQRNSNSRLVFLEARQVWNNADRPPF